MISHEASKTILANAMRGLKISPSARIWRGTSSDSGNGMASYGLGLYTTVNRKPAATYAGEDGEVVEMGRESIPSNPLRFATTGDFQVWLQSAHKILGVDKRTFNATYPDFGDFIRALDPEIDGIQMFTGKDTIFVRYQ